jgi:hypothetical protein
VSAVVEITADVYWDTQDPNNEGWAIRYLNADAQEISGPLDIDTDERDMHGAADQALLDFSDVTEVRVFRGEQLGGVVTRQGYRWL